LIAKLSVPIPAGSARHTHRDDAEPGNLFPKKEGTQWMPSPAIET